MTAEPSPAPSGPPSGEPASQTRTSTPAILALVLAVAAYLACPVLPAVGALVAASFAQREITASAGTVTGSGLVLGARIAAWVNIGLGVALLPMLIYGFRSS
jgi:hypothetical protein